MYLSLYIHFNLVVQSVRSYILTEDIVGKKPIQSLRAWLSITKNRHNLFRWIMIHTFAFLVVYFVIACVFGQHTITLIIK